MGTLTSSRSALRMVSLQRLRRPGPGRAVSPRARRPAVRAVALLLSVLAWPVAATDIDVSAGGSVTSSADYWTPTLSLDVGFRPHRLQRIAASWQSVVSIGWLDARSLPQRPDLDLDRDVAVVAVGTRLLDFWRGAFITSQIAFASETTSALSSHGQFVTSFGWAGAHWVAQVRHVSNANVWGGRNLGETMFLLGARF